jgi:hypothetical protein
LARIHRTPRRRESVARIVSPETRLSIIPSSKAASEAIESVHRELSWPNSLGERWSKAGNRSAESSYKAARVRFGRDEPACRASRPRSLKSWMASRTVCWPHPRFSAICGTSFPFEEARSICDRRRVKVSLERREASRVSRSFCEKERTKIGVFMTLTITHDPKPVLMMQEGTWLAARGGDRTPPRVARRTRAGALQTAFYFRGGLDVGGRRGGG